MIKDPLGPMDYEESGTGPTIVFVPGSCSTGAAWKPVIATLSGSYRTITTSLPGYGRSAERRTTADQSIGLIAQAIEAVVQRAGGPVHLVGHSFGGEVALAVALRDYVDLKSLMILEAPAPSILSAFKRVEPYAKFREMTSAYIQDYLSGKAEAIASMVDFYGGPGTFASWPSTVRDYAVKTTPANILDWDSAYASEPNLSALAELSFPVLVAVGAESHPAVVEANCLLAEAIHRAKFIKIEGATHFMIATHAAAVAKLVEGFIASVDDQALRGRT